MVERAAREAEFSGGIQVSVRARKWRDIREVSGGQWRWGAGDGIG